jgi:hypothetical protein
VAGNSKTLERSVRRGRPRVYLVSSALSRLWKRACRRKSNKGMPYNDDMSG